MILGALEAGGTKMVCAIGDENGNLTERISLPTKTPEETMPQMIEFFKKHNIEALGIGTFGPGQTTTSVRHLQMPCRFLSALIPMSMPQPLAKPPLAVCKMSITAYTLPSVPASV